MADVLFDALLDTLKLFPWLLLIYIVIELIEHKTKLTGPRNRLNGKFGPLIGSATGLIPQCGFSVMAAKLFEQKYITVGTLLAIFVSTSDEAFIILLSSGQGAVYLLPLIVLKIFVGIVVGYAADGVLKLVGRKGALESSRGEAYDNALDRKRHGVFRKAGDASPSSEICMEENCTHKEEECEKALKSDDAARELFLKKTEEKEFECTSCGRPHNESKPWMVYFVSPLFHALKVAAFILAVNVALGLIIYAVTEERFMEFMDRNIFVQPLITSLIGLIPNCASSVVITECFLQNGISFGSCAAGLCANAGLGFVVLLKNTREWKRNLALIVVCYAVAVLVGFSVILSLPEKFRRYFGFIRQDEILFCSRSANPAKGATAVVRRFRFKKVPLPSWKIF